MTDSLKESVLLKYQAPVSSAKDCALLVEKIQSKTKRNISETTIRRFFGLLKSKSRLSKYNLDTLALYCDFPDYGQFCKSLLATKSDIDLMIEFERVTQNTLNSIKKKSLTPFGQTIPRKEVNTSLNSFLKSDAPIYTMIAPGGYGKSTALAHWVISGMETTNQILFIKATHILTFFNDDFIATGLSFDVSNNSNVFVKWEMLNQHIPLVIVIDAWEELSHDLKKQEQLINNIKQVMQDFSKQFPLKIILSIRSNIWEQISKNQNRSEVKNRPSYQVITRNNLPSFSNAEIRMVIDEFNSKEELPIIYESILWDTLDLLKVPFQLYLFTQLHTKYNIDESIGYNQLLEAYLKVNVFEAKYAEEKEDILWALIAFIENSRRLTINKNDLKKQYPIHIKRETNYFNAYADLLATGILEEERIVNKYGLYTTIVQFKHQNYFYYLTALDLIRLNNGLTASVFKNVIWSANNWAWKASIIAILFEIAYNSENFESISHFCELPDMIHESLQVRFTVGQAFRRDNGIRHKIIRQYAKSEKGQAYYFEQFVDTNYLYNNYVYRIKEYLNNKSTSEAILFGNSILFLASFLRLQKQECLQYKVLMDSVNVESNIHPWPIGRKVASELMYEGFIGGGKLDEPLKTINYYKEITNAYNGYFNLGLVTFEVPVLAPLVFLAQFEVLEEMLTDTVKRLNPTAIKDNFFSLLSQNQNILPELVLEYAKFKQGGDYEKSFVNRVESALLNFSNSYDDFQNQILLRWILFDYYRESGKVRKAQHHHITALQISRFAGYDFFTFILEINTIGAAESKVQSMLKEIARKGFITSAFQCPKVASPI